jgi:hypothetical protein
MLLALALCLTITFIAPWTAPTPYIIANLTGLSMTELAQIMAIANVVLFGLIMASFKHEAMGKHD